VRLPRAPVMQLQTPHIVGLIVIIILLIGMLRGRQIQQRRKRRGAARSPNAKLIETEVKVTTVSR
jgi:hypothetical protein